MLFSSQALTTSGFMWDERLSPIKTFFPSNFFIVGKAVLKNQSLKQLASNQPDLVRLYCVP